MRLAPATRSAPTELSVVGGWRAVFGNSAWILLERAARAGLGLLIGAWTARYLGPADYGVFSATFAWVALFGSAAGLGIEPIVVRELVRQPAERMTIMTTATALRAAGGVLAAAAAIISAAHWSAGADSAFVWIASLTTLFGFGETFDLWFQATLRARVAAFARTSSFLLACAARVVLIVNHAPLAIFFWISVAEAVATAIVLGLLLVKAGSGGPAIFSLEIAGRLLRESWPNILSNTAAMAYMRIDRVLLTTLSGNAAAGVYSAAASVSEVWYAIPVALTNSATPLLTELYGGDHSKYARELGRLARLQSIIGWLVALGVGTAGFVLVPVIFGPTYASAAPILLVLAIAMPFTFLGIAAVPWYLNERLTLVAMRRHIFGAVLNVVLNLLLIPQYGALGAAVATTIGLAVAHVFANGLSSRTMSVLRLQLRALALLPSPAQNDESNCASHRQRQ